MANAQLQQYFLQKNMPYVKPLYSIDYKNDDDMLEWLNGANTALSAHYAPLFKEQQNNLKIFLNTGVNPHFISPLLNAYLQQGLVQDQPDDLCINEMYLLVMEQVSTIVSNELTAQVLPNNDDYKDKIAAKFVKSWIDSMSYELGLDVQRVKWEIQKKIFGESFVIPVWNPDKGDIHPAAKDIEEDRVELVDEDGRKVIGSDGEPVWVSKWQRIGDIELRNPLPFDVMIDPKSRYDDSDWFYYVDYLETDRLQKQFPDYQFKGDDKGQKYDPVSGMNKGIEHYTQVYHFYHRSMQFLPEGRYVVATKDQVLMNETLEDHPTLINSSQLPLVRFCELDVGVGVRGVPILFRNGRPIVSGYNRVTNQIYNNLEAESPKVMVHQSAGMDVQKMPNGIVVMEWKGNVKPTIETPSTNTSGIFNFREALRKNIIEIGQQTPMQRGDTPNAQLDSFISLQYFEDLRVQQAAPDIKGHMRAMENLYRMMIAIAKDHYDEEDQRLIKIIGRNNAVNLRFFDPENLQKVYDVKISSTGNLANSKAARTQLIMTLKREFPALMSDEVFVDMLGLSTSEKFQNAITAAVNSAEAENEDMLNGIPVPPPERYEDLITHWDSHRIPLQTREFKLAPLEIKMLFEKHVTATEKLMFEQMLEDPNFASRVQGLRQFPLFFSPVPINEEEAPMEEEAAFEQTQPLPQSVTEEEIQVKQAGGGVPGAPPIQDREPSAAIPEPAM